MMVPMKNKARNESQKNRSFNTKITQKPFCCYACFMAVYVAADADDVHTHMMALISPQMTMVHDFTTSQLIALDLEFHAEV
jgi:hypothetical protein